MCTINNNTNNDELHLWTENKNIYVVEYVNNTYEYNEYPCTILKYKASAVWQKLAGLHLVINVLSNGGTIYPKWEDMYQFTTYHSEDGSDECVSTGFKEDGLIQKNEWSIKEIYAPTDNLLLAGRISKALVPELTVDSSGTQTTTVTTTTTTSTTDSEGNVVTTSTAREVTTTEEPDEDVIEEGVLANFVNTTFQIASIKGISNEYGNLIAEENYQASNPNLVTQTIEFKEGYTWFGLYVNPRNGNDIVTVLGNGIEDQKVFGGTSQSTYTTGMASQDLSWTNKSYLFDNNRGNIMYVPSDGDDDIMETIYTLNVTGDIKQENDIILYPGWTWVSYPSIIERSITDVFADALEGDKVLGAHGQTTYMNKFGCIGWSNTSFILKPSNMYKVYSSCNDVRIIKIDFSDNNASNSGTIVTTKTTTTTTTTTYSKHDSSVLAVIEEDDEDKIINTSKYDSGVKDIIYKVKQGWNEIKFDHALAGIIDDVILNPEKGDKLISASAGSEYAEVFGTIRWSATIVIRPKLTYKYYSKSNKFLRTIM